MTRARLLVEHGCRTCRVCEALAVARSTYYRHLHPRPVRQACPRPRPANRLSDGELATIKDVLHEERFLDLPPREIVPTLADEGRYLASIRTFYRVLASLGEAQERRQQARHPKRTAPILEACGPNQVWSWDITRLAGPWRGKFYFLYVMIDIYSRYVVGWMVSERENARRAQGFIRATAQRRLAPGHRLTIHNDRQPDESRRHDGADPAFGAGAQLFAAEDLGRQSLLRGPVPDPEVSSHIPGVLRIDRTGRNVPDPLVQVVQLRAPAHGTESAHPGQRPLRTGRGSRHAQKDRHGEGVRPYPEPVPQGVSGRPCQSRRCRDQPHVPLNACRGGNRTRRRSSGCGKP
jgi:transposase InsO family protein